jgi:hypothetical protein
MKRFLQIYGFTSRRQNTRPGLAGTRIDQQYEQTQQTTGNSMSAGWEIHASQQIRSLSATTR